MLQVKTDGFGVCVPLGQMYRTGQQLGLVTGQAMVQGRGLQPGGIVGAGETDALGVPLGSVAGQRTQTEDKSPVVRCSSIVRHVAVLAMALKQSESFPLA